MVLTPTFDTRARCPDCLRYILLRLCIGDVLRDGTDWTVERADGGATEHAYGLACRSCHYALLRFPTEVAVAAGIPEVIHFRPGLYEHFKHRFYWVRRVLFDGEDPADPLRYRVLYEPLYDLPPGQPPAGARSIPRFFDRAAGGAQRFAYVGPMPPASTLFDPETGAPLPD